jgi:hypothetical protein
MNKLPFERIMMQTKNMWLPFKVFFTILYNIFLLFYVPIRYLYIKIIGEKKE